MKKLSLSLASLALTAFVAPQGQITKPTTGLQAVQPDEIVYDVTVVEGASRNTVEATRVRNLLTKRLRSRESGEGVAKTVRTTLSRTFGANAQELPRGGPEYQWRWDGKHEAWILVCISSTAFAVNLPTGSVVVEVSEGMPL